MGIMEMPDGPSTTKIVLSVSGLAFDLIGAFLLSIPMVWSSQQAASVFRTIGLFFWSNGTWARISRAVYSFCAALSIASMYLDLFFDNKGWLIAQFVKLWTAYDGLMPLILAGVALFLLSCHILSWAFLRLAEGNHDRRIGAFGLILLGGGFILQFIVNMQWLQ